MKFTARFFAISATVAQVLATPTLTNSAYAVTEGQPFTITWTDADGAVTLLLKDGSSTDLKTVSTIASGLTGNSYTWTPSGLPSDTYAIEITDSTGTNYSPQFTYAGTGTVSTTATGTTTTTAKSTTATSVTSTTSGSTTSTSSSSASTSAATTSSGNSTTTASSTLSKSTTSKTTGTSSTASSTSTTTPVNTNDSKKLGSSLAFVVLTAAALLVAQ